MASPEKFFKTFGRRRTDRSDAHLYEARDNRKSPFETMLHYSTQKVRNADELMRYLYELGNRGHLNVLDIGTSKGTLWGKYIMKLIGQGFKRKIKFTLVEPEKKSVDILSSFAESMSDATSGQFTASIIPHKWEEYQPSEEFDGVICSHTIYHLPEEELGHQLRRMLSVVHPDCGQLYLIARERENNEVFEFIQRYKLMTGQRFNTITIVDALPHIADLKREQPGLTIDEISINAAVLLPFNSHPDDAKDIVTFFLQAEQEQTWDDLDSRVRNDVLENYGNKDIALRQLDRLIVFTRG